jgi:hypothetical protein
MSESAGNLKWVTVGAGALVALIGIPTACYKMQQAREEADTAAVRRKEAEAQLRSATQPGKLVPEPRPGGSAKAPTQPSAPAPKPAPLVASKVLVSGSVWEGEVDRTRFRLEVTDVTGAQFRGKLNWSPGGKLKMTVRTTGRVTDPDQVTFEWSDTGIEYGTGFLPASVLS